MSDGRAASRGGTWNADIDINLVDVGACKPALLAIIERKGVEL